MYKVLYETDDFADGFDCGSVEDGRCRALEVLEGWRDSNDWWGARMPTQDEQDEWDRMIFNSWVSVVEYPDDYSDDRYPDFDTDEHTVWEPTEEDLYQLMWEPWDELECRYSQAIFAMEQYPEK